MFQRGLKYAQLFFAISLLIFLGACQKDRTTPREEEPDTLNVSFAAAGLEGKTVNELAFIEDNLYAATNQGLYRSSFDDDWTLIGFADEFVAQIEIVTANKIFCSVFDDSTLVVSRLYITTNEGETWSPVRNNFGGEDSQPMFSLKYDTRTNRLIAGGYAVVAASADEGRSWTPIFGNWNDFGKSIHIIDINESNANLWVGGQNGLEQQIVVQLDGDDLLVNQWTSLIPAPSTAEVFAFSPSIPEQILIGCENGILFTDNGGLNWSNIYADENAGAGRFYFGLAYDPTAPQRIVAASWDKNVNTPQPILLHITDDNGANWTVKSFDLEDFYGGTRDMLIRVEDGKTVAYLGLDKGGVYKVAIEN